MTTPLPDRCSPSVWAVKASSGIDDCTVTIDLSARSRLTAGPPFGRPALGSPRRGFSVIGPILSVEKARYNRLLRQSGSRNSRADATRRRLVIAIEDGSTGQLWRQTCNQRRAGAWLRSSSTAVRYCP